MLLGPLMFSLVKRWGLGTLQGSVSPGHLQAYLNGWVFRFNRRTSRRRVALLQAVEAGCRGDPLTYR